VDQDSERSFDVDSHARPLIVLKKWRTGTGVVVGGHVDVLASPPPAYDLLWQRWNGTSWVGGIINNTSDWNAVRTKVRVDLDDNIYVFSGDQPFYYVSRDYGATWGVPVSFGVHLSNSRLYSYPDGLDPNYHYIAYTDRHDNRQYFVQLQLTSP